MYLLRSDKCYKSIWKTLYTNLARETWMRSNRLYTSTRRTSKILNLKLFILFTRELLFPCLFVVITTFWAFYSPAFIRWFIDQGNLRNSRKSFNYTCIDKTQYIYIYVHLYAYAIVFNYILPLASRVNYEISSSFICF